MKDHILMYGDAEGPGYVPGSGAHRAPPSRFLYAAWSLMSYLFAWLGIWYEVLGRVRPRVKYTRALIPDEFREARPQPGRIESSQSGRLAPPSSPSAKNPVPEVLQLYRIREGGIEGFRSASLAREILFSTAAVHWKH